MTGARRSHDRGGNGAGAGRRHVVGVSRRNGSAAVGPGTSDERVGGSWPAPPRRYLLGVCVCVCARGRKHHEHYLSDCLSKADISN